MARPFLSLILPISSSLSRIGLTEYQPGVDFRRAYRLPSFRVACSAWWALHRIQLSTSPFNSRHVVMLGFDPITYVQVQVFP
jgi:hypothetical protein